MGDQGGARGAWRRTLKLMRSYGVLRRAAPAPEAAAALLERLSAPALAAAAANPDHSDAGRAAAAAALAARGESAPPWRLSVPGFIRPADLARGERLFFGAARALRKYSGMLVFLSLLAMFVCAGVSETAKEDVLARAQASGAAGVEAMLATDASWFDRDVAWSDTEAAPLIAAMGDDPALARSIWGERIGLGFAGVFGAALLVWLFASMLRGKPARVLLLRKFNVKDIGRAVSLMIAAELRPFGHVASLSDKHIRRSRFGWLSQLLLAPSNPLAAVLLVLALPVRLVWRLFDRSRMGPAVVLTARDYRNLARRLRDRIGLNLQVATTSKESFLVRTSDAWWREVVSLLIESSDAVVVDLSQVAEGTAWELDLIRERRVGKSCVFVARADRGDSGAAALAQWGFANPCHLYGDDGRMADRAGFRAAMLAAMRAAHGV